MDAATRNTEAHKKVRRGRKVQMNIWVDPEDRAEIRAAARAVGMTTSDFVVIAALAAAEQVSPLSHGPRSEDGEQDLSTNLRRLIDAARRGGSVGYADVGYQLACNAHLYPPPDIEDDDWHDEVLELVDLLREGQAWAVLEWCGRHYRTVANAIPARRRLQFAIGAIAAFRDQKVHTPPLGNT